MKTEELLQILQDPENIYRGKPFWAWNGELDIVELKRQIDVMKDMGFGGFFMHSRTGLNTEYLGEHWFACVRACAEYAYSLGMEAWLYDEDRWPSGTAGGLATKKERNRLHFISLYDDDTDFPVLARFAYKSTKDYFPVNKKAEVPNGYAYQVYVSEVMENNSFYNGYTYLDTMNPEAVRDFFELTHEQYKKHMGDLFGKEIKGIFTDEPHRGALFTGFGINNVNGEKMCPYTDQLFERYMSDWDEDLREKLPFLFFGKYPNQTAYRYIETIQQMFLDAFAKPYHDWCKKNNLILTGHILHEDMLFHQTQFCGSVMRYYPHMDYPGMDNLTLSNDCYWAAKQLVSVAKQYKKPFALSEMYAASGWNAALEDFKRTGDWQAFYGITLRCPHLSWYTMKGESKRDYPMSILHQSGLQNDWHYLEDYYARLSYLYTHTHEKDCVAVINPVEKTWFTVHSGWLKNCWEIQGEELRDCEKAYTDEFYELRRNQVPFDYLDEGLLAQDGNVIQENGVTRLQIGALSYETVYDSGVSVRESTRKLLREFAEKGGRIITKIADLPRVSPPHRDIAVTVREGEGFTLVFVVNFSRDNDYVAVKIGENLRGTAYEYDTRENKIVRVCEARTLTADFARRQERIFFICDERKCAFAPILPERVKDLDDEYTFTLSERNILPLKNVSVTLGDEEFFKGDVLRADEAVRKHYGLPLRCGEMLQPWFRKKFNPTYTQDRGKMTLTYTFFVKAMPSRLYIAYEGAYSVTVNGTPVCKTNEFWKDVCFTVAEIEGKTGENIVTLTKNFAECDDIENVYILGNFGVDGQNNITALPSAMKVSDIQKCLPYYAGEVRFAVGTHENVNLRHERLPREICAKLITNDGEKYLCYAPYTAAIVRKTPVALSVVLGAQDLFYNK
mgnify:FL=1